MSPKPPPQPETPDLKRAARLFMRLVRMIRPFWGDLGQSMVLALLMSSIAMVVPYFTKLLVDKVYPEQDVTLKHVLVLGMLVLSLISTLLGGLRGYFSLYVNTRLNNATRLMFFNHLQHLRARFFDQHQVGEINSRFQDLGRALESIGRVFQTVFVQGVYLLLVPPVLFFLDWRLALVAIISLPITFSVTVFSGPILRRRWQRASEAFADLNAFQIETLSHIRTFKTMGLEHRVFERADNFVHHATEQQLRAGGLSQGFNAINGLLRGLNTAIFTWFGWTLILRQEITLGDYLAFSAYVGFLYGPIQQLIQLFSDFQQSAVHLHRMFEYLDEPLEQDPTTAYTAGSQPPRELHGAFSLSSVDFAYHPDQPVLRRVSADLPAGSVTALIGASGSGKTSLLRLLTRLEEPLAGQITVDGRPLAEIPVKELRQQLSVVWQDVALVRGSLWENLTLGAFGTPDAAEVNRCLELCGLSELVKHLPDGLQTEVSEWGSTLSAGQRQRVALARALLRRAPILLLDEATANIDVETEMRILREVFAHLRKTTGRGSVLFVTHRLASARLADRILVLENGGVAGFGSHDELEAKCPAYQRMVQVSSTGPTTRGRSSQ